MRSGICSEKVRKISSAISRSHTLDEKQQKSEKFSESRIKSRFWNSLGVPNLINWVLETSRQLDDIEEIEHVQLKVAGMLGPPRKASTSLAKGWSALPQVGRRVKWLEVMESVSVKCKISSPLIRMIL